MADNSRPSSGAKPTYRKRSLTEALRWDPADPSSVLDWLTEHGAHHAVLDGGRLGVGTLESGEGLDRHAAKPGDWVLRGPRGEFYVCDAEVFTLTYEPAGAAGLDLDGVPPEIAFRLGQMTAELVRSAEERGYQRGLATAGGAR